MSRRRVVVTGMGLISPVGNSVEEAWTAVTHGASGIRGISLFDATDHPVRIAGEVQNFDVTRYGVARKDVRKMARFSQFLVAAAVQAVRDASYTAEALAQERSGVIVGNCLGGLDALEAGCRPFYDPAAGMAHVPPLTTPLMICNEAAANVSKFFGLQGPSWTVGTACAAGTDAIGAAADAIRSGRLDVCVTGGTEAPITGFSMASFAAFQGLSSHFNDSPQTACRPFDRQRDGFVIAEGAAVLILEELEHARRRNATIHAEIAGYGASCDAWHIIAPRPDGSGAALAVSRALEDAAMKPEQIQYYNAHGTATPVNDRAETNMLKLVFKDHAHKLHISSTKSMTGHLVGAAGALEAIFCIKTIQDGFIPPTINLEEQDYDGGCDLDYTPCTGRTCAVTVAASASLGFGGHNGCLIISMAP